MIYDAHTVKQGRRKINKEIDMNRHSPNYRREKQENAILGFALVIAFGLVIAAMLAYAI